MKKLLIVVDMEGIAGIGVNEFWSTIRGHPLYFFKRHLLVEETNAAISGAIKAGLKADQIVVVDWHLTNHNIYRSELPSGVTLIRGEETKFLEGSIEKVFLVGFHGAVGAPARYAHSFSYAIKDLLIDNKSAGETTVWAYTAGSKRVPIALLTGDAFAIGEIQSLGLETVCVDTKGGNTDSFVRSKHKSIELAAERAVSREIKPLSAPSPFSLAFSFKSRKMAQNLPMEYFDRRDGESFVIEKETAYEVYDVFHNKVGAYIRSAMLGHRLLSIIEGES
jgi:D-aminopeptidase